MNCYLNPKIWCEKVLGLDVADIHKEWLDFVQHNKRVAILAPTGFGKTELLAIAYPLWLAWFHERKEILIISKDIKQSTKILERIKNVIEDNELLKDLIPEKQDTWTKTEINTSTKCKIFCKSYNQKETLKSYHVDYAICDEAASYDDPEIFKRYIVTRVSAKRGNLIAISTPVSITDLMAELMSNTEYKSKSYPCIQNGESIWPSKFPISELERIKRDIGVSAFEREYMVNPSAQAEDCLFPPGMIMNCFDNAASFRRETTGGDIILAADFAISSGMRADFDVYLITEKVGDNSMLIWGERHKGINIDAKVMRLTELYNNYKPKKFIVDESHIGMAVIEELRKAGIPVEGAKFDAQSRNRRLVLLRQLFEKKKISLPRNPNDMNCLNFTNILTDELMGFRERKTQANTVIYASKAAHDDTVMALSMAVGGANQMKKLIKMAVIR